MNLINKDSMWIIYALLASLFWGSYAVVCKVLSGKDFSIPPNISSFLMLAGIALIFFGYFFSESKNLPIHLKFFGIVILFILLLFIIIAFKTLFPTVSNIIIFWGILSGALWAGGQIMAFLAFSNGGLASKTVPIYNSNTLVAVILGIILLKEVPAQNLLGWIKFVVGVLAIVIGGVLVS